MAKQRPQTPQPKRPAKAVPVSAAPAVNMRERILEEAETMLFERGYMGLSMEEVAQRVGIRKASIYYHFKEGKEELAMAVAMQVTRRYEQASLGAIASGRNLREKLINLMRVFAEMQRPVERIMRDSVRFMNDENRAEAGHAFFNHLYNHVHQVFDDAVLSGEAAPHDTRLATWMFLSVSSEMTDLTTRFLPKSSMVQAVDMFLGGIMPKP